MMAWSVKSGSKVVRIERFFLMFRREKGPSTSMGKTHRPAIADLFHIFRRVLGNGSFAPFAYLGSNLVSIDSAVALQSWSALHMHNAYRLAQHLTTNIAIYFKQLAVPHLCFLPLNMAVQIDT